MASLPSRKDCCAHRTELDAACLAGVANHIFAKMEVDVRIAQLATNIERVPPSGYGGTELIVSLLTEELCKRGHDVTLFATGDSKTSAKLVSVADHPLRKEVFTSPGRWQAFDIRLLMKLEEMQNQFDLIHSHMGWQALPMLEQLKCPTVTTNHNPIKKYCADIYLRYREMPFVAISKAYKSFNYEDILNYVGVVYNGINCDEYEAEIPQKRDYLLFLGRVGRDKGTAHAMDIAHKLGLPLKIAGKVDTSDREYFESEVEPRLEKYPGMEFIGEADLELKRQLYKNAIAVVYPIAFEEPFGLVMAEALASGTPVMALDRGAVREIVSDGETGIVASSVEELISRFPEIQRIKPEVCKSRVRSLFDVKQMTDGYEQVYNSVRSGAKVGGR